MRSLLVRAVVVLGLAVLGVPAAAHDHKPPRAAVLTVEGEQQKGNLVFVRWYTKSDGQCVKRERSFAEVYPEPLQVGRGDHVVRVRLAKRHRPAFVDLQTWHAESSGGPAGPTQEPPYELKPIRRDGRVVAYRLVFNETVVKDLFVKVSAVWFDREDCISGGGDSQQAYWTFRLEAQVSPLGR